MTDESSEGSGTRVGCLHCGYKTRIFGDSEPPLCPYLCRISELRRENETKLSPSHETKTRYDPERDRDVNSRYIRLEPLGKPIWDLAKTEGILDD